MGNSIQEYLKKINSKLSFYDCASLVITATTFIGFAIFIWIMTEKEKLPVVYVEAKGKQEQNDIRPFGSKSGETYTFSWCQGAGTIKPSNMVYFANEEEAERQGRILSKLCLK